MTEGQLKLRTTAFALRVLKLVDAMPVSASARIIGNQLGRSATSVAANYRAACRSRSGSEMISKFSVVEEEADESLFWLELAVEHGSATKSKVQELMDEAYELTAIMVASRRTLALNNRKSRIETRKS